MFEKCIKCNRMGESCVPNLMLLPFPALIQWCNSRQSYLGWTNKKLAEISKVPDGTISRIKAGEDDCKYSTIRNILIALIGGTTDEFSCTEQVEKEFRNIEQLEQQAAKLSVVETENETLKAENERLKSRFKEIDELHRKDVRAVKEEYQEQIAFLKEQLKAWQSRYQ